jgi:predicted transcriptional regulator
MNKPVRSPLAVELSDEQLEELDRLAAERNESPTEVAKHALAQYLDYVADYRKSVQESEEDFAAGRFRSWEEVEADLRAKFGDFDD